MIPFTSNAGVGPMFYSQNRQVRSYTPSIFRSAPEKVRKTSRGKRFKEGAKKFVKKAGRRYVNNFKTAAKVVGSSVLAHGGLNLADIAIRSAPLVADYVKSSIEDARTPDPSKKFDGSNIILKHPEPSYFNQLSIPATDPNDYPNKREAELRRQNNQFHFWERWTKKPIKRVMSSDDYEFMKQRKIGY